MMGVDELTPGFTAHEYAERRRRLAEKLPPNSVAILAAAAPVYLPNTVIPYPAYRQDADFAYLTGVIQPGVVAMVTRGSDAASATFTLFVQPRNARDETWNGARICAKAATDYFHADESFEVTRITEEILKRLSQAPAVYVNEDATRDARVRAALTTAGVSSNRPKLARSLVHALRWVKSPAEIRAMRECVEADVAGFHEAMRVSRPGALEKDVSAHHEMKVKLLGADRLAYPSVVGSGEGALIVHYAGMNNVLKKGDVLLMDAGCERNGYVSDLTRTWSIDDLNGFSNAQADVYDAVLEARSVCVRAAAVGTSLDEVHRLSVASLTTAMANLGVKGFAPQKLGTNHAKYYPHSAGHWLGMDTHDTPSVSTSTPIAPGTAFTIEPGLYFPADDLDVPRGLRGIGVRIEDTLAIDPLTARAEVLSAELPVDRKEQEELVRKLRGT
jgi:Xaa-Pro aminopeptidase